MTAKLYFDSAGMMTSVQDKGRFGMQALGIPVAGVLDPIAMRLGNALVGNPADTAVLEIRFVGPVIRIEKAPARVALTGTEANLIIKSSEDNRIIPAGQSTLVQPGETLSIDRITETACCTLAFASGFSLSQQFGSLSTHAPAQLGGLHGRALQDGDELQINQNPSDGLDLALPHHYEYHMQAPCRLVLGPQDNYFTSNAIETLLSTPWCISPASNRMGLQLEGAKLSHKKGYNIASDGIVNGAIQVPGNGQPIVLLADRQTTGGYPKIATVISADLPKLVRTLPNQNVTFSAVSVAEAESIRRNQEEDLMIFLESIRPVPSGPNSLTSRLNETNLISGVSG